jgi:transposase-like protein
MRPDTRIGKAVVADVEGQAFYRRFLWAVRWRCRPDQTASGLLAERGIDGNGPTTYRWVQRLAAAGQRLPGGEALIRRRLDETYVKVPGKWTYLYRAVAITRPNHFFADVTKRRSRGAPSGGDSRAKQGEANETQHDGPQVLRRRRRKRMARPEHRQVKYLNNVLEADHGKLKLLIKPVRGFKSMPTAYATIKGFEVMRALRKGQARAWCLQPGRGERCV